MSNYSSPYLDVNSLSGSPVGPMRNPPGYSTGGSTTWNGINEEASGSPNTSSKSSSKVVPYQTYPKRDGITIDTSLSKSDLVGLDMSGFRIKRLPIELFHFGFLQELRLANNLLTVLPPEIGLLGTLTSLDLSNNQLSAVPRELSKLTGLNELLLYNNQLTVLPAELGYLYQVQTFGLEGNPIMEPILSVMHSQGSAMVIPFLRDHMISKTQRSLCVCI
jgi:Leucine-rich repeat (LRR) protein